MLGGRCKINANGVRHALSTRPDSAPPRAMRTPRTRVRGDDDDQPRVDLEAQTGQIPVAVTRRSRWRQVGDDESGLVGEDDGLDAVAEAEFGEDAADVSLDGVFLNGEFLCDFDVGKPLRY